MRELTMRELIYRAMIALLATALLAGTSIALSADNIVRSFPYGSGDAQLGYIQGDVDVEDIGPVSIAASQGKAYVLDRANQRILRFPEDGSGMVEIIAIPADIDPVDIVVEGDKIAVFDMIKGARQLVVQSKQGAGPSGQTEASAETGAAARSQFAALGYGLSLSGGGQNELGGGTGSTVSADEQVLIATDGRQFRMRFVPDPIDLGGSEAQVRGRIVLINPLKPADSTEILLRRQARVKAVRVLRFAPEKEVLVEIDEIQSSADQDIVRTSLLVLASDGRPLGEYLSPQSEGSAMISRSVVVDPESGRVFALVVQVDKTDVVELTRGPVRPETVILSESGSGGDSKPRTNQGAEETLPRIDTLSRLDILEEAQRYVTTTWKVTDKDRGPDGRCDPSAGRYWQRPSLVRGVGATVSGIPYCWGCTDSPKEFLKAVTEDSKRAGNTCARRDCEKCRNPSGSAGVDCSGFISNVWRLGKQVTTSGLAGAATPVRSLAKLRPGDIFNKAGSHVILFGGPVQTSNGEMLVIYESSVTCGGTCRRVVPWRTVENWVNNKGYKAYSRSSLKEEG